MLPPGPPLRGSLRQDAGEAAQRREREKPREDGTQREAAAASRPSAPSQRPRARSPPQRGSYPRELTSRSPFRPEGDAAPPSAKRFRSPFLKSSGPHAPTLHAEPKKKKKKKRSAFPSSGATAAPYVRARLRAAARSAAVSPPAPAAGERPLAERALPGRPSAPSSNAYLQAVREGRRAETLPMRPRYFK